MWGNQNKVIDMEKVRQRAKIKKRAKEIMEEEIRASFTDEKQKRIWHAILDRLEVNLK